MAMMYGGTASQGVLVGILMQDRKLPRIPGDVGNGFTYDFPVAFYTVEGSNGSRIIERTDYTLVDKFIEGARYLEAQGCKCIATSCGFVIAFQKQIAEAVNIPVITSGLLQVPMVARMLPPDKKIGILTANSATLDPKHFLTPEISPDRLAIQGMQGTYFYDTFPRGAYSYEYERIRDDIVDAAQNLMREHPDVGAIVCEGTNFAPYTPAVNRAIGIPIFDVVTMIRFTVSGIARGMVDPFKNKWDYYA